MRYTVSLCDGPTHAVIGYLSDENRAGILAMTSNEFHAHLLKKQYSKRGFALVVETESGCFKRLVNNLPYKHGK